MRAIFAIIVGVVIAAVTRNYLPGTSVVVWTTVGIVLGAFVVGLIAPNRAWLLGLVTGVVDVVINYFLVWFVWEPATNHAFPFAWDQPLSKLLMAEPVMGLVVAELVYRAAVHLGIRKSNIMAEH